MPEINIVRPVFVADKSTGAVLGMLDAHDRFQAFTNGGGSTGDLVIDGGTPADNTTDRVIDGGAP